MSQKTKWLAPLHLSCHQVLGLNWKMNLLVWKNTYLAEQQAHKAVIQRTSGVWGGHGIGSVLWTQGSFSLQVAAMPTTYFSGSLVNPRVGKNDPRTGLLTGHRCTGSQRLTAPWVDAAVICSEDSLAREKEAFTPRLWGRSHAALATSNPQGPVDQALPVICPLHPSSVIPQDSHGVSWRGDSLKAHDVGRRRCEG